MRFANLFKKLSILAVLSLAVACSSTPKVDDSITKEMAEEAIEAATATITRGVNIGADTSSAEAKLTDARRALFEGDYAKAFQLANEAKAEADAAIAARRAEIDAERAAENAASSSSDSDVSSSSRSHYVVRGDNLWSIAGSDAGYNNPYLWPLIYKANKSQIEDADLIFPGQVFDIVEASSASEISAAVNHARNRGAWSIGNVESSDEAYLAQ